jgi:hypothetical protein
LLFLLWLLRSGFVVVGLTQVAGAAVAPLPLWIAGSACCLLAADGECFVAGRDFNKVLAATGSNSMTRVDHDVVNVLVLLLVSISAKARSSRPRK